MKKTVLFLCLGALILTSFACAGAQNDAKWTVMLYLCGTDLESDAQMATANLAEAAKTYPTDDVHFVVETGGTKKWHTEEELGFTVASDRLQRYHFGTDGYTLVDEQPNANMSDYKTLAEFLSWGTGTYPAEKYALILWDHGGGSAAGLIWDEVLGDEKGISISDIASALDESGVHLEALIFDACLMSNYETAIKAAPYVSYMIASEEIVPGLGSNYHDWLQYLYDRPDCDGAHFGRSFCDSVQQKYVPYEYESSIITFSVTDLSRIREVSDAFDEVFTEIGAMLDDPEDFSDFSYYASFAESFGGPLTDIGDFARKIRSTKVSNDALNRLENAVQDAVLYQIKGRAHTYATGLSFNYDLRMSDDNSYFEKQCPSVPYIAMIDAINPHWDAPEDVYKDFERLPEVDPTDYLVEIKTDVREGDPHVTLTAANAAAAVSRVDYMLSMVGDDDVVVFLGRSHAVSGDFQTGIFTDEFRGSWPALDGHLCSMEIFDEQQDSTLYHIPFVWDKNDDSETDDTLIRAEFTPLDEKKREYLAQNGDNSDIPDGNYEVHGVWKGYDDNTGYADRNTQPLWMLNGQTGTLRFNTVPFPRQPDFPGDLKICGDDFEFSEDMEIRDEPLPDGVYFLNFVVKDVFGNEFYSDPQFLTIENGEVKYMDPEDSYEWEDRVYRDDCYEIVNE